MEEKFKPGDFVRLKSGGPRMTVLGYDVPIRLADTANPNYKVIHCCWFDKNDNYQTQQFAEEILEETI